MRWLPLIKGLLTEVLVPLAAASLVAYATVKVALIENEKVDEGEADQTRDMGPDCCCGCVCLRCTNAAEQARVNAQQDTPVGVSGIEGGDGPQPTPAS